ncbi:MAG: ATP-binding protein, partial [Sediminibacterium sp.]
MKRALLLFSIILLGFVTTNHAQQRRLDSILALNNSYHQEDSLKAVYLREVFRAYYSIRSYAKVDVYIDSAILVASHLTNKAILAFTYWRAGSVFHNRNKLRAITYYNQSIEIAKANNLKKTEASAYLNLGALYKDVRDYPKSLDAHQNALQLYVELKDEGGINNCYMNMSNIYDDMGQRVKSMEYIRKALKVFESNEDNRGVAVAYDAIADLYFKSTDAELSAMGILPANRYKEMTTTLDKGLKTVLKTDDNSLTSNFYSKLGRLNEQQGNLVAAKQNYTKAVELLAGDSDEEGYGDNLIRLGNFYINKLKEIPKGIIMLHDALAASRKLGITGTEEDALTSLSNAHEKQHNFDSALYFYRKAIVVKDSIYSKEREQEITRRQLKIDFEIKERDYKTAQQLADARMKQQEQQILLRNQQLQISDKEKTLQRLTFLQKQAELENQEKLQANKLKQEQQKAEYENKIRDEQINVQGVKLTFNKRVSLFLGILAVIVFSVALFIYNSRRKTVELNKKVSEQKVALEELVAVKDKIFSVVSHDMRTPVNNIIAFSSLLEDGDIEQERLALYLEQIKGTLDHTSSLMENMLNWAASQMQGFTPVAEEVFIEPLVNHVLAGMTTSLNKKKIGLINNIEKNIAVMGDQNMIELIVRNLLNNAIKFSHAGSELQLALHKENNQVIFSVKDAGVGMDEAKVAHINGGSTNSISSSMGTGKEKGTGLGLMLCKHFAMLMHGSIH